MKYWYAFQMNREDNDWGTGSYSWDDAYKFLLEQHKSGNNDALVATIEEGEDPICIKETFYEDL